MSAKLITSKSPPFNSFDVSDEFSLIDGQLHIKGRLVIGSANKAGVRYPKQRIAGHRYPIAIIVYVMANWREPFPSFGVQHRDPSRPSDTIDRADNIMPATSAMVLEAQERIHEAKVSGGARGGHLSNNSEGKAEWWRRNRDTAVGQACIEGLRNHRDNEHERAVNGLLAHSGCDELTPETRQWLEMCRAIVARRSGWTGYDDKGFPFSDTSSTSSVKTDTPP
jgi:hypothetical protein